MALLVLSLFSVAGATAVLGGSASFRSSARSSGEQKVLALAEGGHDLARATLYQASNPYDANAVPQQTLTMEGGTVTYSGTYSSANSTWTLTGTAALPNPTGTAPLTQSVSSQVLVTTTQSGQSAAIWDYLYADNLQACIEVSNNVTVYTPLYVRGDLCVENNAVVLSPNVQVGGTATLDNNASIGTLASPVPQAHVVGGCTYGSGGNQSFHNPCTAAEHVYAASSDSSVSAVTKPPADFAGWYQNAKPGPNNPCTSGSFPGGFDNDTLQNRSRAQVDLTPSTSYDCRVTSGSTVIGQISWTPGAGSNPGTLVIAGTVFFDGDIRLTNNANAVYQGRGTIYSSGQIEIDNNAKLCGISGCTSSWNPATNLLALVAGAMNTESVRIQNNAKFQGAVYAADDYRQWNNAQVWGPVVADELEINNNAINHYVSIGGALSGMPTSGQTVTALQNVAGSFSY